MDVKKITERLNKFNQDHSLNSDFPKQKDLNNSNTTNKLVVLREKNLLQLRKNKLDEDIMKNRLNSLAKSRNEHNSFAHKYSEYEIRLSDFDLINFINEEINAEFSIYDEKEELIKKYISNYIEFEKFKKISGTNSSIEDLYISRNSINLNNEYGSSLSNNPNPEKCFLAYAKFAICKLKEISMTWEKINDEGIDFDFELFEMLVNILFLTKDHKIQYEILWIFINLTHDSKIYQENMIEAEILENLFKLLQTQQHGINYHTLWLFSNLLENEELCHIIIKTIPDFLKLINGLIYEYSNFSQFHDIFYVLCWLVYRIFNRTDDCYVESFFPSIPCFLKVFEKEVNNFILKLEMGYDTNTETEYNLIYTILLIFDKFTRYIDDPERLSNLIKSNLMTSIIKLLSIPFDKMISDDLFLIFRVVGGLLSSNNDSDIDYLLNNFGYLQKIEEIIKNFAFKDNPNIKNPKKILKELAWSLSNITGGTKGQVKKVLKTTIPSYLLNFTTKIKDSSYVKEVIFMLYNAFENGTVKYKNILLSNDLMNLLCEVISNSDYTPEVIKLALDFLRSIINEVKCLFDIKDYWNIKKRLEINNIPTVLDRLQYNNNKGIAEVAELILLDNWSIDEY